LRSAEKEKGRAKAPKKEGFLKASERKEEAFQGKSQLKKRQGWEKRSKKGKSGEVPNLKKPSSWARDSFKLEKRKIWKCHKEEKLGKGSPQGRLFGKNLQEKNQKSGNGKIFFINKKKNHERRSGNNV